MKYQVGVKTPGDSDWVTNSVCYRTREEAEASAFDLASRWTLVMDWTVLERSEEYVEAKNLNIHDGPDIKGPNHRVKL